jgi:hypothetical protein
MTKEIKYITTAEGERIAVIIPLEEYEKILRKLGMTPTEYESSEPFRVELMEEMRGADEIDI